MHGLSFDTADNAVFCLNKIRNKNYCPPRKNPQEKKPKRHVLRTKTAFLRTKKAFLRTETTCNPASGFLFAINTTIE